MTKLEELNAEQEKLEARLEEIKRERAMLENAVTLGPAICLNDAPKDGSWVLVSYRPGYVALHWHDGAWRDAAKYIWMPYSGAAVQLILPPKGGAQ